MGGFGEDRVVCETDAAAVAGQDPQADQALEGGLGVGRGGVPLRVPAHPTSDLVELDQSEDRVLHRIHALRIEVPHLCLRVLGDEAGEATQAPYGVHREPGGSTVRLVPQAAQEVAEQRE